MGACKNILLPWRKQVYSFAKSSPSSLPACFVGKDKENSL